MALLPVVCFTIISYDVIKRNFLRVLNCQLSSIERKNRSKPIRIYNPQSHFAHMGIITYPNLRYVQFFSKYSFYNTHYTCNYTSILIILTS
jgi:hypothetical protein